MTDKAKENWIREMERVAAKREGRQPAYEHNSDDDYVPPPRDDTTEFLAGFGSLILLMIGFGIVAAISAAIGPIGWLAIAGVLWLWSWSRSKGKTD